MSDEAERPLLGAGDPIPESEGVVFALYDTHCGTEGCSNGAYTIRVPAPAVNPLVMCGDCGKLIADCVAIE